MSIKLYCGINVFRHLENGILERFISGLFVQTSERGIQGEARFEKHGKLAGENHHVFPLDASEIT